MAAAGMLAIAHFPSMWRQSLQSSLCKPLFLTHPRPVFLTSNPFSHSGDWYHAHIPKGTTAPKARLTVNEASQSEDCLKDDWSVKMLFDGCCPLCMREVNMLRERNSVYKTIKFVDISAPDYSPKENAGVDFATAMGRIHAILPDGTILHDVKAFKKLYEAVGIGWVYAFTKFEPLARIADAIYSIWAKYRLPLTGRPPLVQILEERQKEATCQSNEPRKTGNCQSS